MISKSNRSTNDQQKLLLNHCLNQIEGLSKPIEWEVPINNNEPKYCFCNRVYF